MKFTIAASILLGLLYGSDAVNAYIPNQNLKRSCSKNNLYRALERLQRESRFCEALLEANPTVSIPSSLTATPIASFSTACNCILATAPPPTTTSTATTTSSTTPGGCATSTVTETQAAVTVTVTETPDASTLTVTETAEPSTCSPNEPTGEPSVFRHEFEEEDVTFQGSVRSADNDFVGFGPYNNPSQAHSGKWFYRVAFYRAGTGYYIGRFGTTKTVPVQANTDYRATFWANQFTNPNFPLNRGGLCEVTLYIDQNGNDGIEGPGTAQGGFAITQRSIRPPLNSWTKVEWTFNTRQYDTAVFAFFIDCSCNSAADCPTGHIYIGVDDLEIRPVSSI